MLTAASVQGKEIQRLNNIYKNILKNNNVEHVEGRAYMKDAHTVQVFGPDDQVIREMTAANILVAVGGQPHRLGIPGSEHTITSDEALSLPEQPQRIAILGAGYIAVEFAGIFAGFGSDVHLFYRKDLPLTSAPSTPLRLPTPHPCHQIPRSQATLEPTTMFTRLHRPRGVVLAFRRPPPAHQPVAPQAVRSRRRDSPGRCGSARRAPELRRRPARGRPAAEPWHRSPSARAVQSLTRSAARWSRRTSSAR